MKYILLFMLLLLVGCNNEPKEFTSIEICWQNGEKDTLDEKDGFVTYLASSPFNDEQIAIHKWNNFDNPIIIKTDRLKWFHINYKKSDE